MECNFSLFVYILGKIYFDKNMTEKILNTVIGDFFVFVNLFPAWKPSANISNIL